MSLFLAERNSPRNDELDLCSAVNRTAQRQFSPDSGSTLLHTGKSKMPVHALSGYFGAKAFPVISHVQFQRIRIGQRNLHFGTRRVGESVPNRLRPDKLDFVADNR